jgi:hypothetical protein
MSDSPRTDAILTTKDGMTIVPSGRWFPELAALARQLEHELGEVTKALDECDLRPGGSLADRIRALTHHHREWRSMYADIAGRLQEERERREAALRGYDAWYARAHGALKPMYGYVDHLAEAFVAGAASRDGWPAEIELTAEQMEQVARELENPRPMPPEMRERYVASVRKLRAVLTSGLPPKK